MKAYFAYLWEMLKQFFSDLGQFFYKGIVSPWTDLKTNFDNYQQVFDTYRADFGFGGWLMYILFLLLIIRPVYLNYQAGTQTVRSPSPRTKQS